MSLNVDRVADPGFKLTGVSKRRQIKNHAATVLVYLAFLIAAVPLFWITWTVVKEGGSLLLETNWWTEDESKVTPRREGGGALHGIIGTMLQAGFCAVLSIPIAIMTAIFLVEYGGGGKLSRAVSFTVDILTGVPSIVAGLFIYALLITQFGFDRAGYCASLSLVLLMIPVVVRSTEEMLRIVPDDLREASYALGIPKWKTIVKVVLPTAMSGIITGGILGFARVMGETAPLLVVVGYARGTNTDLFSGFQGALTTMINAGIAQPDGSPAADRMWGAAATLVLLVLLLNLVARLIARLSTVKGK